MLVCEVGKPVFVLNIHAIKNTDIGREDGIPCHLGIFGSMSRVGDGWEVAMSCHVCKMEPWVGLTKLREYEVIIWVVGKSGGLELGWNGLRPGACVGLAC